MDKKVKVSNVNENIAILSFNEPKSLNALTHQLKNDLLEELENINANSRIKCLILTGEGRGFCAGGDLKAMQEPYNSEEIKIGMDLSRQIINKIRNMSKIVIAAVHGYAAGAGMSIALASDLILAESGTRFMLSFKNVGLIPDLGLHYHLPRLVGEWKAKEWIWKGKSLTVREAITLGFVMEEVEKNKVVDRAINVANELIKGPINSSIQSKLLINNFREQNIDQIMSNENNLQTIIRGTNEHNKFLQKFLESNEK